MHDTTDGSHWHEPEGLKNAGYGAWKRPNTPYDDYMEAQGIPIYRGIGVRRVQDIPLKRWNRMGGNGTFIQLYGTEGRWGCYVVEVPAAGALNPERHMYEEIMVVVEGRGTTEIWTDDQKRPHSFEWQRGSMFSIPLNTWHRIVNAASSPALILVASTAPNVMNFQLSNHVSVPLRRQRKLFQAQGRHHAGSATRTRHAQDQPHPGRFQRRALSR
jgi:mannose-6-phosphate isomerase-like protein (cupin superfamily)